MPYRDERCVYVAHNLSDAETTVAFLASRDIEAKVMDAGSHGMLDGLAGLAGSTARGLEVWVDPSRVAEAGRLLDEHAAVLAKRTKENESRGPLDIVCEKCGKKSTFPGDLYGTIQDCPRCGAFIDLGPGEDWEEEAFAQEELMEDPSEPVQGDDTGEK